MITSFNYRLPRVAVELPIEFCAGASAILGRTKNISDTGVLVSFNEPVFPGTAGFVRFRVGSCAFEMQAVVTHMELFEAGLNFAFSSEHERVFMRTLVRFVSRLPKSLA